LSHSAYFKSQIVGLQHEVVLVMEVGLGHHLAASGEDGRRRQTRRFFKPVSRCRVAEEVRGLLCSTQRPEMGGDVLK
jgi:hypothetical protein